MDARFDTSAWSAADRKGKRRAEPKPEEAYDEDPELAGSGSGNDDDGESESESAGVSDDDDDDDDEDEDDEADGSSSKVLKPLSKRELEAFAAKQKKKGVIYISRIPPGMTVPKVKHLLESFGAVERIFLQDGTQKAGEKRKRSSAHFTEGWVEFSSKKVAKTVADMLNAQPIGVAAVTRSGMKAAKHGPGGMKGNAKRFKDDVWTMKYLPGYKWHMLTEQLANERASRTSRLRTELSQSAFEQKDYLRKVERARIMNEKKLKKQRRLEREADTSVDQPTASAATAALAGEAGERDGKRVRTFQQRAPVFKDVRDLGGKDAAPSTRKPRREDGSDAPARPRKSAVEGRAALDSVLSSIF